MISDVIADSVFDRLFILFNTAYFLGVHQVNVRSLHSRFHSILPAKLNRTLLLAGLTSSFSLPLIGLFDNRKHIPLHNALAGTFFVSSAYYLSYIAYLMKVHRAKLLEQVECQLRTSNEDDENGKRPFLPFPV
jgi:hypothetical protein